jgi:hypothetical protein
VIPGSTRLVLIGGEQKPLLEVQIPPQATLLKPLCDRYLSDPPELDRNRIRLTIGKDPGDRRRSQGPIGDADTCVSRALESGRRLHPGHE